MCPQYVPMQKQAKHGSTWVNNQPGPIDVHDWIPSSPLKTSKSYAPCGTHRIMWPPQGKGYAAMCWEISLTSHMQNIWRVQETLLETLHVPLLFTYLSFQIRGPWLRFRAWGNLWALWDCIWTPDVCAFQGESSSFYQILKQIWGGRNTVLEHFLKSSWDTAWSRSTFWALKNLRMWTVVGFDCLWESIKTLDAGLKKKISRGHKMWYLKN